MKELDLRYPTCPIRNILSRMSDKWSLLILRSLQKNGTMRYTNLKNKIPDISQKMLSNTLKRLEEDHLLNRKMYPEIPPRVEYSLTEIGKELMPALQMMIDWAQIHFEKIANYRQFDVRKSRKVNEEKEEIDIFKSLNIRYLINFLHRFSTNKITEIFYTIDEFYKEFEKVNPVGFIQK